MSKLTDNQMYRGMNRRFDKRVRFLARFGFRYQIVKNEQDPRDTHGVLTRLRHGRAQTITASLVLIAPPRLFREMVLRPYLR